MNKSEHLEVNYKGVEYTINTRQNPKGVLVGGDARVFLHYGSHSDTQSFYIKKPQPSHEEARKILKALVEKYIDSKVP